MKKGRFFVTGDCHGDFKKIDFFCKNHKTSIEDYMIILGDAGVNYWLDKTDIKNKMRLAKLPLTFLMVQGNHEERPCNISSYKEKSWNGGTVYWEKEWPTLLFAKDGEIYDLNGKKTLVIGGAYSVDKYFRLQMGLPWFENEQPSREIKEYVNKRLIQCGWKVDYVLSHTCPLCMEPRDLYLKNIRQDEVDKTTEKWLQEIYKKLNYEKWYFGHYHENRKLSTAEMLYEGIKELGSERFLQRLGRPLFKTNDRVLFYPDGKKDYYDGKVCTVEAYGNVEQRQEVSYEILMDDGSRYKNVRESWMEPLWHR